MSYILDALKKSDQERRQGQLPDINALEASTETASSNTNPWPWIAALAIGMTALVLLVWQPWASNQTVNAPPQVDASEPETETADTSAAAMERMEAQLREQEESARQQQVQTHQNPSRVSISAAPESAPSPRAKIAQDMLPQPSQQQPTQVSKPKQAQQPVEDFAMEGEIIRPKPGRTPPSNAAATQFNAAPSEPAQPKPASNNASRDPRTSYTPRLSELSDDLRQQVPDLEFSSHMYSSEPRFRSLIINGNRLKEGQFLDDDIRVLEITQQGVILAIGDQPFVVDVLGRWGN